MKAIFTTDFHYSSKKRNAGWSIYASEEPQIFPSEVIEAAVERGVAKIVPPRRKRATGPKSKG